MSPVVHNQARALRKDLSTVVEVADEVRDDLLKVLVEHFDLAVGVGGHGLQASICLALHDILLAHKFRLYALFRL